MMNPLQIKKTLVTVITGFGLLLSVNAYSERLDRIVAVVEDDVILERELEREVTTVVKRIQASKMEMPPWSVLRKQIVEKMIIEKLQRLLAERTGINISQEALDSAAADIAQRNNMNTQQFKTELESQGLSYQDFLSNLRNEIIINQVRGKEIGSRVNVSDSEVEHYLETQDKFGEESTQYHLGHILIAVKEAASSAEIQKAKAKADNLVSKLRAGQDFSQAAISNSQDSNALKGGDLGWRKIADVPSLFSDIVSKLSQGEITEPIRSPSGFHIVKLLEVKGIGKAMITKTKVRHILIKTNELIDDAEAQKRLLALKARIAQGDDFAVLARAQSDDKGSALKGGSLDWVAPGDMVKAFEDSMSKLAVNEISEPIQTQFGWHILQVLGRENKDNSDQNKKNFVKEAIRKRKIEEETELWLRRLRDESFVEIYEDRI
ncbi:peptidylprolyl isomerase [Crenothrix polyspora]|uniref:Chaperone SurA n=1 Tax=Crenothrix polyspora TaxID=360316 RepID=A0A1R4HD60_9GAMM|nr:peptidylprolyl isomerase [Crenothrix polyspora]SJM94185.1 Chaperone SurA [Crenothrix polyspora]